MNPKILFQTKSITNKVDKTKTIGLVFAVLLIQTNNNTGNRPLVVCFSLVKMFKSYSLF